MLRRARASFRGSGSSHLTFISWATRCALDSSATHTRWTQRSNLRWYEGTIRDRPLTRSDAQQGILIMRESVLSDDHLDLLVTAAVQWRVLGSTTAAAFASATGPAEAQVLAITASQAGQLIRDQNREAIAWLASQGRVRLGERRDLGDYTFDPVAVLNPIEVTKAVHAAQELCRSSPSWRDSRAHSLLEAIQGAATRRLPGYAAAPWLWERPSRHRRGPVGVCVGGDHPPIDEVEWVDVDQARAVWDEAAVVLVSVPAAVLLPPDLPRRAGLHLVTTGEDEEQVWAAITALGNQTLVLNWPICRQWLEELLTEYRTGAPTAQTR